MHTPSEEDEKDTATVVRTGTGLDPGTAEANCTCTFKTIEDLQPGNNLCCIYDTEEEHRELLTPYLKNGLDKHEKVIYIVDARTAETVLDYLRDAGVEVEPHLSSGQLSVLSVDNAYLASGEFDPDGMIGMLADETEKALAEGYSALRVTSEMSWALRGLPGSERLMEYEAKLNRFFPGSKCLAISQYDRRVFEPSLLLNVLSTHPMVVIGTELFDNFYYVPPDEFLSGGPALTTLNHWVSSLRQRKANEETLHQSEEKFHTLFESSRDALMTLAPPSWMFTSCNRAALEMFGAKDEREFTSFGSWDLSPDLQTDGQSSADKAREMIDKALRDGSFLFEWTHRRLGGEEFPATVLLTSMEIGGETVVKATVQDITERRRLEDKLLDASEYAQDIVSTVREPLVVLDDKLRVISANRSFYRTFKVTPEMSENTLLFDLGNRQWEIPRLRELLEEVLPESTTIEDFEVEHDFPAIGQKTMLMNARRIQSKAGAAPMILLAIEDITERRAGEEALLRANEELEGYAQTVSHDLKGPLTSITLAASTLGRLLQEKGFATEGSEITDLVRILDSNVWKSAALIDDLLALAEAGQTPETLEPVDISEVVRSVLEEEEALLEDRGVRVSVDDDLGVAVMDPTHASQVFSNLVGNAVKHNDSENPEIRISRLVEARPGRLRYMVRDNGPGIPEGEMENIFLPFHKEAGSTGTGIGLSIVDKGVRLYGGKVRAYNDVGACFEFTLPIHSSQGP